MSNPINLSGEELEENMELFLKHNTLVIDSSEKKFFDIF